MGPELVVYPFLFVAIFFESFLLVTFLSAPAKHARSRTLSKDASLPSVAIIVPCYNEAETVAGTCESLLSLHYPAEKLRVVLVDDGSTDKTPEAMARFKNHPQVVVMRKKNGGKHTALNAGIAETRAELVGCLDADSFVEPDALLEMIPCFANARVGAATAAMSVHKPNNMLRHMQHAEYIFGIALRHTLASINGLYVTPGPFSLYRAELVQELGGFREGHQTEDMEMALRIQRAGYEIENAPRARVYTKAPGNVFALVKQRTRWTTGFLRNVLGEYRDLVLNFRYGALGMLVLPIGFLAICSGVLLFTTSFFMFAKHALAAYDVRAGMPLPYVFSDFGPTFDWFYIPGSAYLGLAGIVILASISLIYIGKRLSKTPGRLTLGIISYALLYGFLAPLWLIRSLADVLFGKRRAWR